VDYVPTVFMAEAMVQEFPENLSGKRILIPRAKEAREIIVEKFTDQGATIDAVTAYITQIEESDAAYIKNLLQNDELDIITFTSSSTVRNFIQLTEDFVKKPGGVKTACIGPITAQTASEYGIEPDIIAEENTIESLAAAIVKVISKH